MQRIPAGGLAHQAQPHKQQRKPGNPTQPNRSTKRRCNPVPSSHTHTYTYTAEKTATRAHPTPPQAERRARSLPSVSPSALRLPPLPPRRFRAIRGSPPQRPFPPPPCLRPACSRPTTTADSGKGMADLEIGPASSAGASGERPDQSPPRVAKRPGLVMSFSGKRLDQSPGGSPSQSRPVLVMSHSSNRLDQSPARPVLVMSRSSNRLDQSSSASSPAPVRGPVLVMSGSSNRLDSSSPSPSPSPTSAAATAPVLVLSNSGKRMDQAGRKKYVKQVTGRHNDTELHLAAQRGDLEAVRQIIAEIDAQMTGTGEEFDSEVAEIRAAIVNEANEMEATALLIAAEKGFLDIVVELLKHSDKDSLTRKTKSGFDALHVAAREGHRDIVKVLLDHDPSVGKTFGQSNVTPLITAAIRGHTAVVNLLLERVSGLVELSKANGKNALHFAARQGHVEIVQALLDADAQLARRTDKKGQTALHMAVKGTSPEVVQALVNADPAIVMLPDRNGNLALHVATRKKRSEIVNVLLLLPDMNVNALTRDRKTAFDIAEGLPLSEESQEIKECLSRAGAVRANDLNQPRDELRKTVTEIKKDVHTQLEQARKTNKNVYGIAKELRKLHREGINNATNSVTVVAVLFATVAFAAIFTVPGGNTNDGVAVAVHAAAFKVFFIFNAIALFTSLAVVVVQITLVRGETKAERRVIEIINKLMWLASVCTTVAFISSSYIVVGRHFKWAALLVTLIGGVIMAGVLGTMTYYVVKSKRTRKIRKKVKSTRRSGSNSWQHNSEFSDSEIDRIYAI